MNKKIIGISLITIIKFIIVYAIFGITAYILKFHVESEFYTIIISIILAFVIVIIAVPKRDIKRLFAKSKRN
ncbi:TPA: hypothetical protein PRL28_002279 [Staphylococcus aureus]|nr:hypothetical protein [Staphylococcus aureus]